MRGAVQTFLWAWIVLDSGSSSVVLPEITDRKFIDECVRQHNTARSSVHPAASDMLHMSWDEGLAITARAWAKRCVYEHNTYLNEVQRMHPVFPFVGENIWAGYPPSYFTVSGAVKLWVNEFEYYNYKANNCSKVCGHYTQIAWASTYKVGCAAQLCVNGIRNFNMENDGVFFVCNYAPAGNWNHLRPYNTTGAACSQCDGTCENNLCSTPERDAEKSYSWKPDWDTEPTIAGRLNYVTILIVRPIALLFTFIIAYAARYKYPNVFCYE